MRSGTGKRGFQTHKRKKKIIVIMMTVCEIAGYDGDDDDDR